MPNYNPQTGIAYGYISASALDPDIVQALCYGDGVSNFRDHAWESYVEESVLQWRRENPDESEDLDDSEIEEILREEGAFDDMGDYDLDVSGIYEGVHYASSWLGGALNFWILQSPVTTDSARRASPCVPGAAILDTLDGSVSGYDVPADWRWRED